jgi:hypothetical protein
VVAIGGAPSSRRGRGLVHEPFYLTVFASAVLSGATGYLTSRLSQRNQRMIDRQTFRLAILAELRGLHQRLLEYEVAFAERVLTGQISSAQVLRVLLQAGDTVVFNNHASSIGLFDRRTALRVVRFYAAIRSLEGRALVLAETFGRPDHAFGDSDMQRHLDFVRQLRRRVHVLIRRLRRRRPRFFRAYKGRWRTIWRGGAHRRWSTALQARLLRVMRTMRP